MAGVISGLGKIIAIFYAAIVLIQRLPIFNGKGNEQGSTEELTQFKERFSSLEEKVKDLVETVTALEKKVLEGEKELEKYRQREGIDKSALRKNLRDWRRKAKETDQNGPASEIRPIRRESKASRLRGGL